MATRMAQAGTIIDTIGGATSVAPPNHVSLN